ncbi:hypothetical protein [Alkanindiges illinoisensis]|uniref:hypothetical protein n=1 Tax=Alkanindiges illinoisensis TaxID=197183 RepID=UPI0004799850|nr:hypothetical protein [Alkanindiges illinoisensis]
MIEASVTGDSAVVASIREQYRKITTNVEQSIGRLTLKLLTRVKVNKLSGQVLNVRTGRLRRSITQKVVNTPSQITGIVGTNVEYARAHEIGFNGQVSVKAHLRQIKMAWGKSITPRTVEIRAHSRQVNLPEKSFLRSALTDMAPEIRQTLQQSVRQGIL